MPNQEARLTEVDNLSEKLELGRQETDHQLI